MLLRPVPLPLLALALALCAALAAGCDATPPVVDASPPPDAGTDAPPMRRDSGPPCELSCGAASMCCFVGGAPTCVVVGNDVEHCGSCNSNCVLTDRGDACSLGTCTCGDVLIGCLGGLASTCCLGGTGSGRCADLRNDFDDCGACSARCDPVTSDHCGGGTCTCGAEGRLCEGAREACCAPRFGGGPAICADLRSDRENCGECALVCATGDICRDGVCASPRDAGPRDGGVDASAASDAGGMVDAGLEDTGLEDAGAAPEDAGDLDASD